MSQIKGLENSFSKDRITQKREMAPYRYFLYLCLQENYRSALVDMN